MMLSPNAQEFIPQTGPVQHQQPMQHHHQHHHQATATTMPITTYLPTPTALGIPSLYIYSGNASPIVPGTTTAAYTPTNMFNYLNNYFYTNQNASYNQDNVVAAAAPSVDSSSTSGQNEVKQQQQQQQPQQQHVSYQQAPQAIIYNGHLTQASAMTAAYPYSYQLSPIVPATYMPPTAALINYSLQPQPQPQQVPQPPQQLIKNNMTNNSHKYYGQNVNQTAPALQQQHQMYQQQSGPVYNKNLNNAANKKGSFGGKFNKNMPAEMLPAGANRINANKFNNNKKRSMNGDNVELDEKDWPSLNVEGEKQASAASAASSSVVIDEATRKMSSFKNVNLIKYTVQQHYMNETIKSSSEHRSYGDASKQASKLSFKEAVMTKPIVASVVQSSSSQTKVTKTSVEQVNKKPGASTDQNKVSEEQQSARRKSNRKRRGARKSSTKQKTDGEEETDDEDEEEFDLNKEDFPGLADASDSAFNPTDTTHSKNAQNSDKQVRPVSGGGKKSRQPITYEFATMISALEKGEQKEKPKYKDKFSLNSMNSRHMQNRVRPQLNSTGSNLKTAIVKKGKERETPKKKKPSTLKKIILKEREEKKRQKDQIQQLDQLPLDVINDVSSPLVTLGNNYSVSIEQINTGLDALSIDTSKQDDKGEETEKDSDPNQSTSKDSNEQQSTLDDDNTEIMSNQLSPISQNSPISVSGYSNSPYTLLNSISNDRNLVSLEKLELRVKQKIHSRKFREYCNQIINKDIDEVCSALLHEIVRFQDRLYHKNPTKAKAKRRYVMGIREVTKHLKLAKLKCVILAPNCEKIQTKGGLDDAINNIIKASMEQNVPFLFALGRKGLGKAVNKLVPISVVGIFDYSGAEEYFKKLVELANNAKLAYQNMVEAYEKEECENLITEHTRVHSRTNLVEDIMYKGPTANGVLVGSNIPTTTGLLPSNPRIPSHMGHSRNASNGSNISIEPFAYHMNYHTHSRSASGTFNYGHTTNSMGGHSRSASSGGPQQMPFLGGGPSDYGGSSAMMSASNAGLNSVGGTHWTHSRTPSNCSNISMISRLSEPMSEVGGVVAPTSTAAYAAVQYYTEQVRQEMREGHEAGGGSGAKANNSQEATETSQTFNSQPIDKDIKDASSQAAANSLANIHLGIISEIPVEHEEHEEGIVKSKDETRQAN